MAIGELIPWRWGGRRSLIRAPGVACLLAGALLLYAAASRAAEPTGDALFATHCATCHGPAGEGDGPAANAMKIAPPNLRALAKGNGGQFPRDAIEAYIDGRKQVAAHGDRLMPIWGDFLQMPADKGEPGADAPENRGARRLH